MSQNYYGDSIKGYLYEKNLALTWNIVKNKKEVCIYNYAKDKQRPYSHFSPVMKARVGQWGHWDTLPLSSVCCTAFSRLLYFPPFTIKGHELDQCFLFVCDNNSTESYFLFLFYLFTYLRERECALEHEWGIGEGYKLTPH